MSVKPITNATLNAMKRKSAQTLPNRPSNQGMSAEQIKNAFWKFVLDNEDSIVSEIARIINETNSELTKRLVKLTNAQLKEIADKHFLENYELNNGDLFIAIDNGDYKVGHIYKLSTLESSYGFTDVTQQELDKKFTKNRTAANAKKTLTIGEDGETIETDYIHIGDIKVQKGTEDGNPYIEFVFPEES